LVAVPHDVTGTQALLFKKLKEKKPGAWYDAKKCGIDRRSCVTKALPPEPREAPCIRAILA